MPIRETFWNIPLWAEIGQYVAGLLTILVFVYGVYRRVRTWRMGQPERRIDRLGKRFLNMFSQAILQLRTAQDVYPGIMHLAIFWGMATLFVGTILATVDWDVTHLFFDFQFLKGAAYVIYELILDVLSLLVLVGLGLAAYRRYIIHPPRLQTQQPNEKIISDKGLNWDDAYALVILLLIALSGYLVEGLRIAVVKPDWAPWSPVGNLLASAFTSLGDPTNRFWHTSIWIFHGLAAFSALASIPYTKLFHILAAPLNIFFSNAFPASPQPAAALAPVRDEGGPGVKEWRQFTWKQILDFEACTRCGRCQDVCPAYSSGLILSPRQMMIKLEAHLWEKAGRAEAGHAIRSSVRSNKKARNLHGEVVTPEELWACTTCRACMQVCPVFIEHIPTFVDLRRHLVVEGQVDVRLQDALASLGRYGNSFNQSERMRARWTQPVQPKIKDARKEPVECLWFVGDYASYSASLVDITRKTAEVFQKAGLDFGILYESERNAGNDVRRVGEEGLYEMLVEKNSAALGKCNFKRLVTTDPHTYNTLKNEYSSLAPADGSSPVSVLHYSELLDQLIASKQIQFSKKLGYKVTYHDPCYLGRYNGIYDAPRRVIAATGCQLVEMPRNRHLSYCCGAGGGRIWMEEGEVKQRASDARIQEAVELAGVEVFVVACPKDITMYRDAVKTTGNENRLVVKDLIELVSEAM